MAIFKYLPLDRDKREIRILTLEAGLGNSDIRCHLRCVSLNDSPHFSALSYVWGDATDLRTIQLDGKDRPVTRNLELALLHLRTGDSPRHLWVDALCINQCDDDERGSQVRIMTEIYKKAAMTISWVGEASENSSAAMRVIRELGDWARDRHAEIFSNNDLNIPHEQNPTEFIESMGFPLRSQNWPAVCDFLGRPYWTRAWVIQELAAKGKIGDAPGSILCGEEEVQRFQFDFFCRLVLAMVLLRKNSYYTTRIIDEPFRSLMARGHPVGFSMFQAIWGLVVEPMFTGCKTMSWLVRMMGRFESTDPRDKLYALLGLASDGLNCLNPDYTKPYQEVIAEFAISDIKNNLSLRILLGNKYKTTRGVETGPSWTPNLFSDAILDHSIFRFAVEGNNYLNCRASGSRQPVITANVATGTLRARGVLVARLENVIGPLQGVARIPDPTIGIEDLRNAAGQHATIGALCDFSSSLKSPAELETFWRTICINIDVRLSIDGGIFEAPVEFGVQKAVAFLEGPIPEDFMPGEPEVTRVRSFTRPFWVNFERVITDRTFFTMDGDRMGIGPYCAQTGDVAVVLFGCPLCLILRPTDDNRYQLVGDAYIHGAMNGEMVDGMGDSDGQVFVLC